MAHVEPLGGLSFEGQHLRSAVKARTGGANKGREHARPQDAISSLNFFLAKTSVRRKRVWDYGGSTLYGKAF